ncbi:MAG TPA: hypothetical protein VK698_01760 [Kofleriaceae bacterium]|nr:hypothetical protein [Kofleriaceae bacterium]
MSRITSLSRGALCLLLAAAPLACGGDDDDDDAPGDTDDDNDDDSDGGGGAALAFSLPAEGEPVSIADIPFPNDLLRADGDSGAVVLAGESFPFPSANPEVIGRIAEAFGERDCFGPAGGVIFPLADTGDDVDVDPGSLTSDSVRFVDLATGERIATETYVRDGEHQVYVRPERGAVLAPGATYAVLLTRDVTLVGGVHVEPTPDLGAVLAGDGADQPRLAAADRAYAPLRAYLDAGGDAPASDEVAGAAVFTTCDYAADLDAVVGQLDARPAPAFTLTQLYRAGAELDGFLGTPADNTFPGVDNAGGIAHADIGFVALGTFESPNYQSATPGSLGTWERDGDGAPVAKGVDPVPVILILPAGVESYTDLPVVVYTHGLGDSKSAVLAVGNTLCARGFAVIGIDIPFHGDRFAGAVDTGHNFGGGSGPDGLADSNATGPLFAFFDITGDDDTPALDPRVQADSFRQAAVDLMALSRLVDGGDLSAIGDAEPALADLGLRGERITYASESFGGFVGLLALAFEPRYQAGFLSVAGGGLLTDLLENSPTYGPPFMLVLGGAFGVSPGELDGARGPAHTHQAFQILSLLLGPGDPMTYAARLPAKGVHVVLPAAYLDESVPNQSGEAVAAAMGLSWVAVPGGRPGPSQVVADRLPLAELPLSGNHRVGDQDLTAGFFEMDPASHGMLTRGHGERRYEVGFPPFVPREEPEEFDNPIVQLQAYLAEFAESYAATGLPVIGASDGT